MWSVVRVSSFARGALLLASLFLLTGPAMPETSSPEAAGISALDPAFRLAAGGLALAGPLLDAGASPASVWLLSEDHSLYSLNEEGALVARISLAEGSSTALFAPYLALDSFGRVLVSSNGTMLSAFTRMGARAWTAGLAQVGGRAYPPAFGSDGRTFAFSGRNLVCLNPSGLRLWSLALPAEPSCPPGVDGRGFPCVGLVDGSLLIASPYGALLQRLPLGSSPCLLFPLKSSSSPGQRDAAVLAAGLEDGRVLLIAEGAVAASYKSVSKPLSLASDGQLLYGLDATGEAFALSLDAKPLWRAATGCLKGSLYLFSQRLVAAGQGRAVSLSLGGEVFRELRIPGSTGTIVISPAGLAFSSGADWILAAYRFEKALGPPRLPELLPYPPPADISRSVLLFDPQAADSSRQLIRLADIEKSLRSGTMGEGEREAAAYCSAVATRTLEFELSQAERRRRGNPLARARACYLLGALGSPDYREPLFRVLESDIDSAVRVAACDALAAIAVDSDGRSMTAFLAAASKPIDDATAVTIVRAIEGMELRSGLGPNRDGLRSLVKLATAPYGQSVRDRAVEALGRISGAIQQR